MAKRVYNFICCVLPQEKTLSEDFEEIRSYITADEGLDLASLNFIDTEFMTDRIRPLHKIHVSLYRWERLLVGYLMIFGTFRYAVLLASNYSSILEWADLDYTLDPVTSRQVEGKPSFRTPPLSRDRILRPKQSREYVRQEIYRGLKAIDEYRNDSEFLDLEIDFT